MAIQIKGSHVSKVTPAVSEIEERELAVNTKDGKLYTKTPEGNIIEIGSDNINTGLETPTPTGGVHSGHRYINATDLADFLPLGVDATDLSYSSGSNPGSASIGAGGIGSFTAGIDATAKNTNSVAIGYGSYVEGDNSFSIGNSVQTTKNLSINIGNNSLISGSVGTLGSFSIGANNSIAGDGSITIGINNNIPYNNSILLGNNNNSLLSNSFALGHDLETTNVDGNVVLGKFNDPKNDKLFIIGSGTTDVDRSNSLELDSSTGVLTLPKLNSVGNIQTNYDVITLGYLESYSNIVRTVNGYSGNVSLTVADINEQSGVDRLWFTQNERDQIASNSSAILTKEPLLPVAEASDKVLTVIDPVTRTWAWKTIGATSISMSIGDLTDVLQFDSTNDINKYLKVNGAGTQVEYAYLQRSEMNLLPEGQSTTDSVSGLSFELDTDPYYWGINQITYQTIDDLNILVPVPDTTTNGDKLVVKFTVTDSTTGEATQNYEVDTAVNLPYDNTSSGLSSVDVQNAIDELNTSIASSTLESLGDTTITSPINFDVLLYNGTEWVNDSTVNSLISVNISNIGDLSTLSTTDQSSLVNAVNEVDSNLDSEVTRAIGVEGDLSTLSTTDQSSLVNAVNEVDSNTNNNTTNITTLQGYILGSGATADRPDTSLVGAQFFDTDLTKPIWYDGSEWVDATGTAV